MQPDPSNPTFLYRFFAADGSLLYVGITERPFARWHAHETDKAWWRQIARIESDLYPTRTLALEAEALAIETEDPRHNRRGGSTEARKRRRQRKVVAEVSIAEAIQPDELFEPLDDCRAWVADYDGSFISAGEWARKYPGRPTLNRGRTTADMPSKRYPPRPRSEWAMSDF